jgi:hypothetical protein
MGGYGSGTRWTYSKKRTVEDCRTIRIFRLQRDGHLKPGSYALTWSHSVTNAKTGSLSYTVQNWLEGEPESCLLLRLFYKLDGDPREITESVKVETTRPNFGGQRFWFVCPLERNGSPCNRRVADLHLIPGGRYFGCRHCLNLTYTSRQTHNKRFDEFSRMLKGEFYDDF